MIVVVVAALKVIRKLYGEEKESSLFHRPRALFLILSPPGKQVLS